MAGVVDPFLEAANRVTSVSVIAHGRTLAHMPFVPAESPYPFIAMVPQNVTEKLLSEQLAHKNGTVEYEASFISAVQHDDLVSVTLECKGQHQELTAAFVVGCDGAHSAVRHLLDLPFEGAEYHNLFLLADIETNETLPADQLQLCPNEFGPLAIFPISATRRRIVATVPSAEGDSPSLDLVRKILQQRAPVGIEARALHWSSYFHKGRGQRDNAGRQTARRIISGCGRVALGATPGRSTYSARWLQRIRYPEERRPRGIGIGAFASGASNKIGKNIFQPIAHPEIGKFGRDQGARKI
jgi:2-polyprenyl-6-methoxyphenol hydroxylase-like FAD-dependent oxidoreductase